MMNREAVGYLLCATKELGLDKKTVESLYSMMYRMFDMKTEYEASEQGIEYYYSLEEEV
jgi:hypothetical protein